MLGYLLCLLISVVPIPALTHIFMFYLSVRSHHARSQPLFRKEMETIERRIQNYEALGTLERIFSFIFKIDFISFIFELYFKFHLPVTLALIIEASMESYFQFWLQINYSLPDIFTDIDNIEELVTWRTLSIVLSFITITFSVFKIRF